MAVDTDAMAIDGANGLDSASDFNSLFQVPGKETLPIEILGELQSISRINAISPQEVFYKWESYAMKMGSETKLDLANVREFKVDTMEGLEREARERASAAKQHGGRDRGMVTSTPKPLNSTVTRGGDFLGMLEGMTPTNKRKVAQETPAPSKSVRSARKSSPGSGRTSAAKPGSTVAVPFNERQNAGQIVETLNSHLQLCEPPIAPPSQPRVSLKANTDLKKFYYKPLSMHQSEASEVLDDRIDEFTQLIADYHRIDASAFGNAASKSTAEVVAVGRIASDSSEGKLNESSVVLELSRRQGAGLRVPLKFSSGMSGEFFPGQIVGFRGTNASGDYFSVTQLLDLPPLPPAASYPSVIEEGNTRLGLETGDVPTASQAMSLFIASGPYTADDNLDFEPFHVLCEQAAESSVDVLVLNGPFLDIEHPLIASGDIELPEHASADPDQATLSDVFRAYITEPLRRLVQAHPSITIVLVPSTRDAINKHTAYPQEPFTSLKKDLGLPKQVRAVTNPCTLSFNEIVLGISSQDILNDLRREEVIHGAPSEPNLLTRLPRHLLRQRHFYPLYPAGDRTALPRPSGATEEGEDYAIGTPLDPTYLKLAEMLHARPDILVVPSALLPFAKVVDSVVTINPGPLSKRRGPGTFARLAVHPRQLTPEERSAPDGLVENRVFDRVRGDVIRI